MRRASRLLFGLILIPFFASLAEVPEGVQIKFGIQGARAQLVYGVISDSDYPVPPESESDWIATEVGAGVCTSFTDVSGALTTVAAGFGEDGCFVHKSAPSGDLQFSSQIVSITESLTPDPFFGPAIRKGTDDEDPYFKCFWRNDRVRCAYRTTEGGEVTTGVFGSEGFTLPVSISLQCDASEDAVIVWESDEEDPADADDWTNTGSTPMPDFCTGGLEAGFMLSSQHASNTATMVVDNAEISDTLTLVDQPVVGERNVHNLRDFETGQWQTNGALHDGGRVLTLPHPQTGGEIYGLANGGCGPDSDCQSKVVESCDVIEPNTLSTTTGETIEPRDGDFFLCGVLWQATHKAETHGSGVKPVSDLPGNVELDYPRKDYRNLANGALRNAWPNTLNRVDFDVEIWWGGSFYFPESWEVERGSPFFDGSMRLLVETGTQPSNDMWGIEVYSNPCCNASSESWLYIVYETNNQRIELPIQEIQLGRWTDFVVNFRANPCASGTCNYPGVGTFSANQGIFQAWASDPTDDTQDVNGCYDMIQYVDRVNQPMGPRSVNDDMIHIEDVKFYAPGWGNFATGVYGPVTVGIDEVSWGFASEGTDYTDVHPKRCAQP